MNIRNIRNVGKHQLDETFELLDPCRFYSNLVNVTLHF